MTGGSREKETCSLRHVWVLFLSEVGTLVAWLAAHVAMELGTWDIP